MKRIIYIARPHGMCAGVRRALETVESVLAAYPPPIYVLHELVHNNYLVNSLRKRGVHFAEELEDVPDGSVLLLSAHGVSSAIEQRAAEKRLHVIDATCPLVKRLHVAAAQAAADDEILILLGHRDHPEVAGIVGRVGSGEVIVIESAVEIEKLPDFYAEKRVRLLSQTTLNQAQVAQLTALLKRKIPHLQSGPGVCYATENRQRAVRLLARKCRHILVIGSPRSSNSNRLREIAEEAGALAWLIDGPDELPNEVLSEVDSVGVSAGASAPEELVEQTVARLLTLGFEEVQTIEAATEEIRFRLPQP